MGWSAVYILYNVGDRTAPWGTPAKIGNVRDFSSQADGKKAFF